MALLEAAKIHNAFEIAHGEMDNVWRKIIQEVNNDPRLPSEAKGLLKKDGARSHVAKLLDAFELQDPDNARQTGFGDEEYAEWEQLHIECCQLRADAEAKKSKGRKQRELQQKLKELGERLRKNAAGRAHVQKNAPSSGQGAPPSGDAPSGPNVRVAPSPGKGPLNPRQLAAMSVNVLQDQEKRKTSELLFKNEQLAEAKRRKLVEEEVEKERLKQQGQLMNNQQDQFTSMMMMMNKTMENQAKQTELLTKLVNK